MPQRGRSRTRLSPDARRILAVQALRAFVYGLGSVVIGVSLWSAVALLLGRFALSQMDVPTRQAYVVSVVDPSERTAAAAFTNTARYAVRPAGPLVAGAALQGALGAPFLVAGALKSVYDLELYSLFRKREPR